MNRSTKVSIAVAVLILVAAGLYFWLRESADQKKVRALQEQMTASMSTARDQPSAQRFQNFNEIRQQVSSLPQQLQQQFHQSARKMFMSDMERRVDEYLKMDEAAKKKEMDKRIDEMESMRKMFASRGGQGGGPPGGGPPGGPGPGGPSGPPRQGGPPSGGPRGPGGLSGILDNTTPDFRAKMGEFMRDMRERRRERGLPDMPGPGGRM